MAHIEVTICDSYRDHYDVPYNNRGDDETSNYYGYGHPSSQASFGVGESV